MENTKLKEALTLLSPEIRKVIEHIPESELLNIQEIRLRAGKFLTVTILGKEFFVSNTGKLSNFAYSSVNVSKSDLEFTFKTALQYSIHSYSKEISQGYVTTEGGNRVGFCGTSVVRNNENCKVETVKNISGINIRIAREVIDSSLEIYQKLFLSKVQSLLIIGPPSSGKTTVLRDLCRLIGESASLSIIDERNELSATYEGISQNNVGLLSDVFCSYPKFDGIMTAVKVMSPKVIVCDEIGSGEDYEALEYALNSGVKLIATTHASSYSDAMNKPVISKLLNKSAFDYAVVLGVGTMCGKIIDLVKTK